MTQTVAIIDYGAGNLRSAAKAFESQASETNANIIITNDIGILANADRIVLPGVGAFADCMNGLNSVEGLREVLEQRVIRDAVPFIGVCVGMQLLAKIGREKGETEGLGWIDGIVEVIKPSSPELKVPHMGWNTLSLINNHALLDGLATGENGLHAYFVHSYHMRVETSSQLIATTDYGAPITAIVARDNLFATQFHPEKSQKLGLGIISNFLKWKP